MSFNPHTHAGCDKDSTYNFEQAFDVSIHTPTQGVTKLDISNVPTENVSIHTPTQGVTSPEEFEKYLIEFQSTHPRRV